MIKVNVISGFLGAGKTTLIKYLANALIENNEKVVILENEFGKIGIDGKMLEMEGLSVYEISSGCICCTLKDDFIGTLIRIADEIRPDRILIEPSGIFVLSEMYDIFRNSQVNSRLTLCSAFTVIDSINFLKQREHYGYFFENQISYANKLILSKINGIQKNTLIHIMEELQKINPKADILTNEWTTLTKDDYIKLLEFPNLSVSKEAPKLKIKIGKNKTKPTTTNHGDHNFMAFGVAPQEKESMSSLKEKFSAFKDGSFGVLLRAKGHVVCEAGMLQFNYVDGTLEIIHITKEIEPSICFIGEELDKKGILELFST